MHILRVVQIVPFNISLCSLDLIKKSSRNPGATKCMTLEQKLRCIMCRAKLVDEVSKEEIKRLVRNWAKKGKVWAICALAQRYLKGVGVKQSDTKAIELLETAAKRGNATAQGLLGTFYDKGMFGLTQSDRRAIEYYTLAANQGHPLAQYALGGMYAKGQGIEQSFSQAREWWTKAAAQGHESAIQNSKS